ncbi:LysR family transcriptional regulator [Paraburkholderia kirstenboschensis]|uniref:LysR family transcriptional regulator n=1 Tax=Paraburkholderia kirstenboschensis TaxID=1245436 RepID=A0ABZ0EIN7_9BURK|nr:LysR family transcriptional regulator [Paraburkholderia kirstenboschensis]WOD16087.1 LysR family transcriptional regulator [Paraburkholderia kirstenboschensis]
MELHHLEAFSAVMSAGSMTGAGKLMGRSQPGVTRMIQELEQEIGYALFERKGPRVTPTGRAFRLYEEVERSLVGLDAIRASARAIGADMHGPLRVAATPALAAALVPRAVASLNEHVAQLPSRQDGGRGHPVDVQLRSASAEQVVQALLARTVEVGIATLPLDHAALNIHYIVEASCVAVLHRDHPSAHREVLTLEEIAGHAVVTVANRYRLRHRIDAAFSKAGLKPLVALETNASLNAVMAAHAQLGVAVVDPATAYGTPIDGTVVRPIDVHIPFLFGVATLAGKPPGPAASQVIESLGRVCARLMPGSVQHAANRQDRLVTDSADTGQTDMTEVSA